MFRITILKLSPCERLSCFSGNDEEINCKFLISVCIIWYFINIFTFPVFFFLSKICFWNLSFWLMQFSQHNNIYNNYYFKNIFLIEISLYFKLPFHTEPRHFQVNSSNFWSSLITSILKSVIRELSFIFSLVWHLGVKFKEGCGFIWYHCVRSKLSLGAIEILYLLNQDFST